MEYKLPFSEYNKALRKNKLMGLKCNKCEEFTCPPQMACQSCGSLDLEVVQLSGKGKIVTFTTQYIAPEGRENEVPYTIAMVELDEGPWLMGNLNILDPNPQKLANDLIGKRVKTTGRVYPGDKYSAGSITRPLFTLED